MTDVSPSCAICGVRPSPEFPADCPHEAEALTKAFQQALERSEIVSRIRDWVINKARQQIGRQFEELKAARVEYHNQYVQRLPCYSLYQQYRGNPPFHTPQLQNLKAQIHHANGVFAQGVDDDWRRSCLEYPNVLDYFFGLVDVDFPDDDDASVRDPVFGRRASPAPAAGHGARRTNGNARARRGSGDGGGGHRRRERRRSRARTRTPPRAPSVARYR